MSGELTERLAAVRAAMAPRADGELAERCESLRRALDPAYAREAEIRDDILAGRRDWDGKTLDAIVREARRGQGESRRWYCRSCFAFIGGGTVACSKCRDHGPHIFAAENPSPVTDRRRRLRAERRRGRIAR